MSHLPEPTAMTNREAGYALRSDPRATALELHVANLLIGGGETANAPPLSQTTGGQHEPRPQIPA